MLIVFFFFGGEIKRHVLKSTAASLSVDFFAADSVPRAGDGELKSRPASRRTLLVLRAAGSGCETV